MVSALHSARLSLRRPPASARWPITGASSAISSPAAASEMLSQVAPDRAPGGAPAATSSVR